MIGYYIFKKMLNGEVGSVEAQANHTIVFQIVKKVQFGKALFVCGSLQELGGWDPLKALRLEWGEGDRWEGQLRLSKQRTQTMSTFQFKLVLREWEGGQGRAEWEIGLNRRISIEAIFQGSNLYYAEWNMQNYIFFLKTQDFQEKQSYYIEGSLQILGGWKEKKAMQRLGSEKGNPFISYWKNNPEFTDESSFSRIFMISFSVPRDVEAFNYYYISFGSNLESQSYPGRTYQAQGGEGAKDRIMEFEWEGSRVVIDESTFDKLLLERFTHQIYLASHIQNCQQFLKVLEKKVTVLFVILARNQDYRISTFNLRTLCKDYGLLTESRTLEATEGEAFVEQVKEIVEAIEALIIKGHRVCLNISSKVMKLFPIYMLYLILFMGYSFGEALELVGRRQKSNEGACKMTRELYNFISGKFLRGKIDVAKA